MVEYWFYMGNLGFVFFGGCGGGGGGGGGGNSYPQQPPQMAWGGHGEKFGEDC